MYIYIQQNIRRASVDAENKLINGIMTRTLNLLFLFLWNSKLTKQITFVLQSYSPADLSYVTVGDSFLGLRVDFCKSIPIGKLFFLCIAYSFTNV